MTTAAVHPADPILQAYGLGKLDDASSASVSKHLERCDSCQRRVAELSSDEFLGRLQKVGVIPDKSTSGWSPSAASSTEGAARRAVSPPQVDTLPPELVDHPDYEIVRELGRGGMGVVYLANNRLMGRPEVLKVVGRHLIERPGVADRFLREIRSAAKLHHPNIVSAHSALRLGASLVLAMEYVEGLDLAKIVKTKGPLPVAHACYVIYEAALGLQHAHERGMVHRDIKPANLVLASEGKKPVVKVLDFGLAKVTSEGQVGGALTREGQMLGTPDYIAPEQIRNARSADIRADIYSLGCTYYYLLTGGPPFPGEHVWDIYQAHFSMDATPLNLVRPEVPVELAALVGKMMAKEPGRRFQTPGEVARALVPFFKNRSGPSEGARSGGALERQPDVEQPTVGAHSMPAQPTTIPPSSAVLSPQRVSEQTSAVSIWEGLIDLREQDPLVDSLSGRAAAGAAARYRQGQGVSSRAVATVGRRGLWTAAGVLLLGSAVALAFVLRVGAPKSVIVPATVPVDTDVPVDGERIAVNRVVGEPLEVEPQRAKHTAVTKPGDPVQSGQGVSVQSVKESALAVRQGSPAGPEPNKASAPARVSSAESGPGLNERHEPIKSPASTKDTEKSTAQLISPARQPDELPKVEGADVARTVKNDDHPAVGPPTSTESVKNSTGMTLHLIPAGEFMMGSPDPNGAENERPEHKVRLSSPFFMGVTEVTQAQYAAVMRTNPSYFSPEGEGKDKIIGQPYGEYPVEQVSWVDAALFCNALSMKERVVPYYRVNGANVQIPNRMGPGYRLPTEAEWEYACRGGKSGRYSVGPDPLAEYGWFARNSEGSTHPVGKKRSNEFGLYDMGGNVWEWCGDEYAGEYYKQSPEVDPPGPSGMSTRVVRGGTGWRSPMRASWYSNRSWGVPSDRSFVRGFRVARFPVAMQGTGNRQVRPASDGSSSPETNAQKKKATAGKRLIRK